MSKASMLAVGVFVVLASCHDGQPRADDAGADGATPGDFAITAGTDGGPGCPGSQPQGGCSSASLTCNYGSTMCVCVAPELMWACCSPTPLDCPMQAPSAGSVCCSTASVAPSCGIACGSSIATTCTCSSSHWACSPGC